MNYRLEQFLSAENLSQSQFADNIGVARANVSHILAGRNRPGFDFIEAIAKRYPTLNLEWFITGKGKMYKDSPDEPKVKLEMNDLFSPVDESPATSNHRISRIIVFFDDGTYQELK